MQTVTTSVYLQWHQWSLWRGLSKAVVLAFREVKEAPPSVCSGFSPKCSKNKMVFWKILHFPCVEPRLCLRLLQLFKPGRLGSPHSLPACPLLHPDAMPICVSLCVSASLCFHHLYILFYFEGSFQMWQTAAFFPFLALLILVEFALTGVWV